MRRSTLTLPNLLTRPTSLRPRSTSITCSARSFSSLSISSARAWSSFSLAPRGREAQKEYIRAGIDGAQGAIDLEAVNALLDIEALAEHGLEDIARGNVLLDFCDACLIAFACRAMFDLELCRSPLARDPGQRLSESLFQLRQAAHGLVIR